MEHKNDKVCLQEIWRRQALLSEPLKRFGSILWRAFTCRTCILCAVRNGVIWWLFLEFNCIKKNASRHPRLSPFFVPTIKLIWMVQPQKAVVRFLIYFCGSIVDVARLAFAQRLALMAAFYKTEAGLLYRITLRWGMDCFTI